MVNFPENLFFSGVCYSILGNVIKTVFHHTQCLREIQSESITLNTARPQPPFLKKIVIFFYQYVSISPVSVQSCATHLFLSITLNLYLPRFTASSG